MTSWLGAGDPVGATPLEDEDVEGLIPTFVATRDDLNLVEHANIEKASFWLFRGRRVTVDHLLVTAFADRLHRRVLGDVWRWAGARRTRETNIGIDPSGITVAMKDLFDDARHWHANETFSPEERAVRIHHRLVSIHPYRNGNGRHSRLMADAYLHVTGTDPLSWGGQDLTDDGELRRGYIKALRDADRGDIGPLLDFARR